MGIGAQSPLWRKALFRVFQSRYLRRKCTTADGTFEAYVSPSSSLTVLDFRKSLVDPVHERFIDCWVTSASVVWDIGGNLGLFALPAALKASAGHVYAFEPDIELAHYFLASARLPRNKDLNMSVLCVALSKADGAANFQISKFSRAMNKLEAVGKWHEEQIAVEQLRPVPTMRIDTLATALPPPNVLKIDVEGAEIDVLEGGEMTIAKHRPVVLIEGPRELWDQMQAFFERHQYTFFDGDSGERSLRPVWNTIAVPQERVFL
jgi:FkbM family methyltransferase